MKTGRLFNVSKRIKLAARQKHAQDPEIEKVIRYTGWNTTNKII